MNDIAAYYDHLATIYGHDPRAVDAPDRRALEVRYEALGDVADLNGKRVLEVGCGYGGLGAYLTYRYPKINYRGIDISAELLAIGRQAHPELQLSEGDVMQVWATRYDIVLAQGIFYKLTRQRWWQAQRLIAKMYSLANETVAFTALVEWERDPGVEYRLDPVRTLAYCKTLAPGVMFRNDYWRGDALFALYRKAP